MDCDESLTEDGTIPDVPKILSPGLYDVFPIFASMLDIKSFMKLAMTSKEMYKRCTEDKSIRICVNDGIVSQYDSGESYFHSIAISRENTSSYLEAIRKLGFTINLREVRIGWKQTTAEAVHRYLTEIRTKRIGKLCLCRNISDWDQIVSFVKDFPVNIMQVWNMYEEEVIPLAVLRSLLQMNFKEFLCWKPTSIDLLLETNSPIQKLSLMSMENIPRDKFMQILWMIQTGSLLNLKMNVEAVDWSLYDTLPFNQMEPLPEERPLLLARTSKQEDYLIHEYWFLHWQGGITKCVMNEREEKLEVFKCDPHEYPHILRKEEDILKDLSEKRSGVLCLLEHFCTFSSTIPKLSRSFKEPLPPNRPLYFEDSETNFWRLDEDDNLMSYSWEEDCATWKPFKAEKVEPVGHPALTKYMFWKELKKNISYFHLFCNGVDEFNTLFDGYKLLDRGFMGPLPEERPLIFNDDPRTRSVLFTGHLMQCTLKEGRVRGKSIGSSPDCAKSMRYILQDTSRRYANGFMDVLVDLEIFRDGVELFKSTGYEVDEYGHDDEREYPLVWTETMGNDDKLTEECWYSIRGTIMKATWKDGRLIRSPGDLREFPLEFIKEVFAKFTRRILNEYDYYPKDPLFLKEQQFRSSLEQFTTVPFDYSGPLKSDSPLVFVKEKIRHTCGTGATTEASCQCTEISIHAWFLWENMKTTYGVLGAKEPQKLQIHTSHRYVVEDMPPALKSKEFLTLIMEYRFLLMGSVEWFGSLDDLLDYFKDYKKLPFNQNYYEDDIPEERPLVFQKEDPSYGRSSFYFLRENHRLVLCSRESYETSFRISHAQRFWKNKKRNKKSKK